MGDTDLRRVETLAVIGAGKMAYDCLTRLSAIKGLKISHLVTSETESLAARRLIGRCEKMSVATLVESNPNAQVVLEALSKADVDLVLNINSFRILKPGILGIPPAGIVNFHNGPLPRYGGVNIPTWAIWNGEKRHGVTWHYVDTGIDTGDIIAQSHFELRGDETAATLIMKCIQEGVSLFDTMIEELVAGTNPRRSQLGERSYYSSRQIPNEGYVDLAWSVETMDRFLRSLDFRPFPNAIGYPRLKLGSCEVLISSASADHERVADQDRGFVTAVNESSLDITIAGGRLRVYGIVSETGEELGPVEAASELGLEPGSRIND